MKRSPIGDNVGLSKQPAPGGPTGCCTPDWTCRARGSTCTCCDEDGGPSTGDRGLARHGRAALACSTGRLRPEPVRRVDRVDERRPLRPRQPRVRGLGRRDRRCRRRSKGLAPLAAKTDKIDARVLAELARRDLVPAIWLPTRRSGPSASGRASGSTSSATGPRSRTGSTRRSSRSAIPCPMADLFGVAGRELLDRLQLPEPWRDDPGREPRPRRRPDGRIDASRRAPGARCRPPLDARCS